MGPPPLVSWAPSPAARPPVGPHGAAPGPDGASGAVQGDARQDRGESKAAEVRGASSETWS